MVCGVVWCVVCGVVSWCSIMMYLVVTVMIYGAVVHHPSEAGACLGGCLVDALSQGLESKQITDVYCNPLLIDSLVLGIKI